MWQYSAAAYSLTLNYIPSPLQSRSRVKFWSWIHNIQHAHLRSCVGFKLQCNIYPNIQYMQCFLAISRGYLPSDCREWPLFTWNIVLKSYVLELCPFRHCAPSIPQVRAMEKTEASFAAWWECFGYWGVRLRGDADSPPAHFVTEPNLLCIIWEKPSLTEFYGWFWQRFFWSWV